MFLYFQGRLDPIPQLERVCEYIATKYENEIYTLLSRGICKSKQGCVKYVNFIECAAYVIPDMRVRRAWLIAGVDGIKYVVVVQ